MSNMSRPIRPGRCMSAIAAARCSATRCAACWRSRAMTSPANITSTTPARRSTCSRARPFCRYREALGENIGAIPEGLYPGDYLKPVGQALAAEYGDKLLAMPECEWLPIVRDKAIAMMMDEIKGDLAALNIRHDVFFSERSLIEDRQQPGHRDHRFLRSKGDVYEGRLPPPKGGPVEDYEDREQTLFRATAYGDDVDRPLMKSDGSYTYFASDIANHKNKFDRGFQQSRRRLRRRPRRLHQAHAGGGQGRHGRQGGAGCEDRATGQAAAQRRAGEDVETLRRFRHLARGGRRGRQGRRALHDAATARTTRCWISTSPR